MVKSSSAPQQTGQKLVISVMDTHTKIVDPMKSTVIKSSVEFASRSLNIFNKLNAVETKHNTWMLENETYDTFDLNDNGPPPITADVFKKPLKPVSRKRKVTTSISCPFKKVPFKKDRKKWIKYSLEDIPLSSDATNSAVALQFLNELREKKRGEVKEVTSSEDKVVFRKPVKRTQSSTNQISSTSGNNNEGVEQYSQSETVSAEKRSRLNGIKLNHLQEDFDESI